MDRKLLDGSPSDPVLFLIEYIRDVLGQTAAALSGPLPSQINSLPSISVATPSMSSGPDITTWLKNTTVPALETNPEPNVEGLKRKTSRPRENKELQTSQPTKQEAVTSDVVKRGRGRPRKKR